MSDEKKGIIHLELTREELEMISQALAIVNITGTGAQAEQVILVATQVKALRDKIRAALDG